MRLTWFGRYRETVSNLIFFANSFKLPRKNKGEFGDNISLSIPEWQVLETVIEYDDQNMKMIDISNKLCMPQSTVSFMSKQLFDKGLVEKYRTMGNKKNIILKPTPAGYELYQKNCEERVIRVFSVLFEKLDALSDDQLQIVNDAIKALSSSLIEDQNDHDEIDSKLLKLE